MDVLNHVIYGFQVVLHPINFAYCFLGVFVGTLIGVLPGIGPIGAMAILLPSTYHVEPVTGIIMLAGIYYGAMYGGSTTSILVNIPGEAASVVTCIDGYEMAKRGRAGPALGISALGSFIGGTIGIVIMMFLVMPLASIAVKFGPPEYFGIMLMGLSLVTYLARGSILKAVIMSILGLFLDPDWRVVSVVEPRHPHVQRMGSHLAAVPDPSRSLVSLGHPERSARDRNRARKRIDGGCGAGPC